MNLDESLEYPDIHPNGRNKKKQLGIIPTEKTFQIN